MLFNSYPFLLLFLPLTLIGFALLGRYAANNRLGMLWLVGCSLFFYGWWNPAYLALLICSVLLNYATGCLLIRQASSASGKHILIAGIILNIGLIAYFKYAGFLTANLDALFGLHWDAGEIILPLAISFFTFQQIAYLVDAYQGKVAPHPLLDYSLFVTFFPQLIAGPIVHYKEMLPQFRRHDMRLQSHDLAIGISLFAIGLFKKCVLADQAALIADPVFDAAGSGISLSALEAWTGALAYTFQLYFDFSGYCDMAIGMARMFGIRLPLNFHSPYKARSIIDFWRCWHMTLSRFLRDYLYIPLGGNRKGPRRRRINLMLTMLLGGLWHGAGWNFVVWGGLHGLYLLINHSWQARTRTWCRPIGWHAFALLLTFTAVVVAWVFFRAESLTSALAILAAMAGLNGAIMPTDYLALLAQKTSLGEQVWDSLWQWHTVAKRGLFPGTHALWLLAGMGMIVWLLPNSQQIMLGHNKEQAFYGPLDAPHRLRWRATPGWACGCFALLLIAFYLLSPDSAFLYFQF